MSVTLLSLLAPFQTTGAYEVKLPPSPYETTNATIRNIRASYLALNKAFPAAQCLAKVKGQDSKGQELYTNIYGQHAITICLDSFNATERLLSRVKSPDTVNGMNRMLENLLRCVNTPYAAGLRNFLFEVFRHNADCCAYQTDYDDGEYLLLMNDPKNRTQIEINVLTLTAELPVMTQAPQRVQASRSRAIPA